MTLAVTPTTSKRPKDTTVQQMFERHVGSFQADSY